jgi:signal transduction histidine kinase
MRNLKPPRMYCKNILLLIVFLVVYAEIYTQPLTRERHIAVIDSLSGAAKVDYILENNYALYSLDFDFGLNAMKEATALAQHNKWKAKEAYARTYQGIIYFLKGDYKNSLPEYLSAHEIFDSLKHYSGLARLSNEIAIFHGKQKDFKTAHKYLDESMAFSKIVKDQKQLANTLSIKATYLEREGKVKEAEPLYIKVYEIFVAEKDSISLSYALLDMSNIALRKGDLKKALQYLDESTAIREIIGDKQGIVINIINKGEAYLSTKNYQKAIEYFNACLKEAIPLGYTDLVRYTYDQLATAHVNAGDYKSAFAYQEKGFAYKDSLFNIERTKTISEIQTKYQTEKKEQQIQVQHAELQEQQAQLQKTYVVIVALIVITILLVVIFILARNHFRKQQQLLKREHDLTLKEAYISTSIQSQETERKRFAQDLHDGMGQLISALKLMLQPVTRQTSMKDRLAIVEKSEEVLNEMHNEIRRIAFNLMPNTLLQQGLVPALKEATQRINVSEKTIVRVTSFDLPPRLTEVQEISLYRIIQEWINNILKYADASVIEVQLIGHEQDIAITIEDNGKGFDQKKLEQSQGNGWKNIQSRINLIKGEMEIDSTPDRNGTTLTIKIPVALQLKEKRTTDLIPV